MFCTFCGNEMQDHASFCSRCGKAAAPSPAFAPGSPVRDWNMHVNILAWLLIGSGVITGFVAMMIIFAGQFVGRMPFWQPGALPMEVARLVGSMSLLIGLLVTILAAAMCWAGIGLRMYRDWARIVALIMSVLLAFEFPVGTGVAIYAFWVLLSAEGREYFKTRSREPEASLG